MTVVDPLIGKTIAGRYVVERRIGQGGMGAVYAGRQEPLGRPVAIKVLLSGLTADLQAAERFQVEATAVARLNHPGIVTVYDYGKTDDGTLFLAMELVDGTPLRKHLDDKKRLPWPEALSIARQTASALAVAHEKGIVHRDLKPDNLMLVRGGEGKDVVVKVLDFGLAKMVEGDGQALTQRSVIMGTPGYMSPEQIHGLPVDSRCDLYALGVIFWEMLVGRAPIVDDTPIKILMRHLSEEIPAPTFAAKDAGLPRAADEVVLRLLQKDREQRPRSTRALADVLEQQALEPWAAPAPLALAPTAARFDVDDWDQTFSALSDGKGRPAARGPDPVALPKSSTLVLQQEVVDDKDKDKDRDKDKTAVLPSLTPATMPAPALPPSLSPAPSPPPVPSYAPPAPSFAPPAPSLAPPAPSFAPPPPSFAPPAPLPPPPAPPPAPPANRFGPPSLGTAPQLTVEREKPRAPPPPKTTEKTTTTPTKTPVPPRVLAFVGVLGVLAVGAVVDFAVRGGGAVIAGGGDAPDVNADDHDEAIAARELQGTRLAIDAALERARLAVDASPTRAARTRLAELIAEQAQLNGSLDGDGVAAARALLPSVAPRGKAALFFALGQADEARALLVDDDGDRRTQALLAEIVAGRDPALALRLLEKDVPALGTRPLRARGRALLASGDVDGALAALDQRLAAVNDDATARALRARARLLRGEPAAARADVDAAIAKAPLPREALALKLEMIAPTAPPKELDALLATWATIEARHPAAIAARLDALRLARRAGALPAVIAAAKDVADVDVVVARARALVFVGDAAGAHAALAAVDAATLPPLLRSQALALSLATAPPAKKAAAAQAFAAARPASATAALARTLADGKDVGAVLPLLVSRPRPDVDDDEALVLAALVKSTSEPLASALLLRLQSGKTSGVAAWAQKKPQDPRSLLVLANVALDAGDEKTARLRLQRVEAMKDLSDDVVRALQLLFARVEAHGGHRDAALARLSGQPPDAATLLTTAQVLARLSDAAGAKAKLAQVRALDPGDRDVVETLRGL